MWPSPSRPATQEVVKPALPIAGLCHYRHCHAVNGHGAVDLVLGTGAYAAGFDAAALTAADVGIGYFGSGKSISLARSYFLDPDGPEGDEVKDVCDRLRDERQAAGLLTGMAAGEAEPDDRTDGTPRTRAGRLARHRSGCRLRGPHRPTGQHLARSLRGVGRPRGRGSLPSSLDRPRSRHRIGHRRRR